MRLIRWTAPERMVNDISEQPRYTRKCDVYSYGILLWEIATQQLPFGDVENYRVPDKVKAGERPTIKIPHIPPEYQKVMVKAWNEDPGDRPVMSKIHRKLHELAEKLNLDDWMPCPSSVINEEMEGPGIDAGIKYYHQGKYKQAWQIIEPCASQKMREAQYYVGNYYINGYPPVPKDVATGLQYWNLAADNGHAEAAFKFSLAYSKLNGEAGKLDPEISQTYFQKAVELEYPAALYKAGIYYFQKGRYAQGQTYLEMAHTAGVSQAKSKLEVLMKQANLPKID
ncbi:hypothetical protein G9A89_001639 [Geosiphon pyriformis]|nr:hypothetical protein G9A89_001639 [Geosiphon pyriformis]